MSYAIVWADEETRRKRLAQMLEELARGDRYMKMPYRGRPA